jgi:hypothetical protein
MGDPKQEVNTMAKFVLVYRGGSGMAAPEEQQAAMEAWMNWFGSLGEAVVDPGSPFGPSAVVSPDGSTGTSAPSALTGYTILAADSLDAAATSAKGCPVLADGGTVEVYEALPIG